jgi:L-fuconolactonase
MLSTEQHAMTRRVFLQTASVGLAGLASAAQGNAAEPEPIPGLDAHTHFYDTSRPQGVPWPGKQDKLLYRPVLPDEFKQLTTKQHIRSTIVVEASPWLEDNQWLLDLAAKEPFIVGVVGHLDPASDAFARHFDRFARDPLFRGIRINHADLRRGLEQKAYLDNLRLLVKHDRELDVNGGPDMPADVAKLAGALPELRIVINHAANLKIDGEPVPADWRKDMRSAAVGKQVFCKVSALVEGTRRTKGDAPAEVEYYRPTLDALWELFGEDRLLYGSNWPVSESAAPYATVHEIVRSYFQKKGNAVAEKFFLRNAVAAYKPVNRNRK